MQYSSGNELFFAALYLLRFSEGPLFGGYSLFRAVVLVCAPVMVLKVGYFSWTLYFKMCDSLNGGIFGWCENLVVGENGSTKNWRKMG